MEAHERYQGWSTESLVQRIAQLEAQASSLRAATDKQHQQAAATASASSSQLAPSLEVSPTSSISTRGSGKRIRPGKKDKAPREFNIADHPCRKIALRFSYEGSGYSGLAAQNGPQGAAAPLPTVEEVLWNALVTARLVDPAAGMEGAGWSRCGRTDRGVSAAGQVVALWVRSKRMDQWPLRRREERLRDEAVARKAGIEVQDVAERSTPPSSQPADVPSSGAAKLDAEELPYVPLLNRILPSSIRVQAWSPVRPDFSARFDCTYRHYKYFFSAGPSPLLFPATPEGRAEAAAKRLDIAAMRDAATRLLGEHDFRNLCKVDASKQITNHRRRIDGVGIDLVSSGWPSSSSPSSRPADASVSVDDEPMYVFNLRGTAFLYHQVRNIMAVLFLVGARLEKPQVVDELMNVDRGEIARDRIKTRIAALSGVRDTANATDPTGDDVASDSASRWWLPANATSSHTDDGTEFKRQWGRPQWIETALGWSETEMNAAAASAEGRRDDALEVYETKPNYEMASDRPLMLWECGFLPSDVSWRAGPYDGPFADADGVEPAAGTDSARAASTTVQDIHALWSQMSIKAELQRHFILASASAQTGRQASRSDFEAARWPTIAPHAASRPLEDEETKTNKTTRAKGFVPLGYGTGRGALRYIPLAQRSREESVEEKNRRWLETTGKRRAERAAATTAVGRDGGDGDDE